MNVELTVRAVGTTSPDGVEVEIQTREEFLVFFFTELSKSNNLEGDCGNGRRRSCAPGDERREERARVTREEGSDDGVGKERLRAEEERGWPAKDERSCVLRERATKAKGRARETRRLDDRGLNRQQLCGRDERDCEGQAAREMGASNVVAGTSVAAKSGVRDRCGQDGRQAAATVAAARAVGRNRHQYCHN